MVIMGQNPQFSGIYTDRLIEKDKNRQAGRRKREEALEARDPRNQKIQRDIASGEYNKTVLPHAPANTLNWTELILGMSEKSQYMVHVSSFLHEIGLRPWFNTVVEALRQRKELGDMGRITSCNRSGNFTFSDNGRKIIEALKEHDTGEKPDTTTGSYTRRLTARNEQRQAQAQTEAKAQQRAKWLRTKTGRAISKAIANGDYDKPVISRAPKGTLNWTELLMGLAESNQGNRNFISISTFLHRVGLGQYLGSVLEALKNRPEIGHLNGHPQPLHKDFTFNNNGLMALELLRERN